MEGRAHVARKIGSFVLLFIGIIAISFVFFGIFKEYKRASSIDTLIQGLEEERDRLDQENTSIQREIAQYDTPAALEKKARENNNKKPGENVVIIAGVEEVAADESEQTPVNTNSKNSHLQAWWKSFFLIK